MLRCILSVYPWSTVLPVTFSVYSPGDSASQPDLKNFVRDEPVWHCSLPLSLPVATKHWPRQVRCFWTSITSCTRSFCACNCLLQKFQHIHSRTQSLPAVNACFGQVANECPPSVGHCASKRKSGSISGAMAQWVHGSGEVHAINTQVVLDLHISTLREIALVDITIAGNYDCELFFSFSSEWQRSFAIVATGSR